MNELFVYEIESTEKDNKNIPNFKNRKERYIFSDQDKYSLQKISVLFRKFVKNGKYGETSRIYIYANKRNADLVRKELICKLVLDEELLLGELNNTVTSIALKPKNRVGNRITLNFNDHNKLSFTEFLNSVKSTGGFDDKELIIKETPEGYTVVTPRFFDLEKIEKTYRYALEIEEDGRLFLKKARKDTQWKNI